MKKSSIVLAAIAILLLGIIALGAWRTPKALPSDRSSAIVATSSAPAAQTPTATASKPTTTSPSLTVISIIGRAVTVRYENMPYAGVRVTNSSGDVVWTQELGHGSGATGISLPDSLPAGTYILNAFGQSGTVYARDTFHYEPNS